MMHPRTFVAQTTCAHTNHFYKSVLGALEFDGPAIICCYTTCQPEHGVADNMATDQARLAVDTRAFPLLVYDPRKGDTIRQRLSLQGNPAVKDDWWVNPKTGQVVDFIDFQWFPIFNVADMAITIGGVLLVLSSWHAGRHAPATP